LFADKEIVFLAHNAKFEYMVLYKHFGIRKIFKDTFLASKKLTAGLEVPKGYNSLASTSIWYDLQKLLRLVYGRNDDSGTVC
jgi:hypothetical protein